MNAYYSKENSKGIIKLISNIIYPILYTWLPGVFFYLGTRGIFFVYMAKKYNFQFENY
jgi:hypothetical protein